MEEYLASVFAVSAVAVILGILSYRKGDGINKFAFSVLVMYVTLTPISAVVEELRAVGENITVTLPEIGEGEYGESLREAFCLGVAEYICSELSLDEREVSVSVVDFNIEKMTAALIKVTLCGRAAFADKIRIENLVADAGLGKCEVQIEIG